jgi:hypothetical protein
MLGMHEPGGRGWGQVGGGKKNDGGFTYIFPYCSGQSLVCCFSLLLFVEIVLKYPLILNDFA